MGVADAIKMASRIQNDANQPAALMFGVVMTEEPNITIQVDGRFTIEKENIVLPKHLRKGQQWDSHRHEVFAPGAEPLKTGSVISTDGGAAPGDLPDHAHMLEDKFWTNDETFTLVGRETYKGLKVGDKVALLRNAGGQQYYVLGVV